MRIKFQLLSLFCVFFMSSERLNTLYFSHVSLGKVEPKQKKKEGKNTFQ